MSRRIHVWVQEFTDRSTLQLQWLDSTGRRRTKSAGTGDPAIAEAARCDLEADLNAGRYQPPSRTAWSEFRQAFMAEHVAGLRPTSRASYAAALDHLERHVRPARVADVSQRVLSQFVAALRARPLAPSTIRTILSYVHGCLSWGRKQG